MAHTELPSKVPDLALSPARSRPRAMALRGVGCAVVGVAMVAVAAFAITSAPSGWRWALAAAGAVVSWVGLQSLGRRRFGPDFELGLWAAAFWLVLVIGLAITADWLPLDGIDDPNPAERYARPALELDEPLGRDAFGRSLLSRTIYGARASLIVGTVSVALGMTVGSLFGLIAGAYRGIADSVIRTFSNSALAFPPLVLLLAIVAVFDNTLTNLTIGLAILTVPTFVLLARAQTLLYAEREFVTAARGMGASNRRVIIREILPNAMLPVASYGFIIVAVLIIAEGSLSYIGLGIAPPRPSWGGMIADGQTDLRTDPYLVFVPAAAMFLTVLAFNRVGDFARRALGGGEARI